MSILEADKHLTFQLSVFLFVIVMANILFVCMYNAGRSPFAEYAMKRALESKGVKGVHVSSAGLIATDGLTAPPKVIESAKHCGIDVSPHKRRLLTKQIAESADEIYVFEKGHVKTIESSFPAAKGRVHVLREIMDLKGHPIETHVKHFREIKKAVEGMAVNIERK